MDVIMLSVAMHELSDAAGEVEEIDLSEPTDMEG